MSPNDSMKEATFTAEELGIDGGIQTAEVTPDGDIRVEYDSSWGQLLKVLREKGTVLDHDREFKYVDFHRHESLKFSNHELFTTEWHINAVAVYDDNTTPQYIRVWFVKD